MGTTFIKGRKTALLLLILALPVVRLLPGCRTDLATGVSGDLSDSLQTAYYDDAVRLSLRSMQDIAAKGRKVNIPVDSINYYLNRLVDVWIYASRMENKDSVDMMLNIHAFNNPSLRNIVLTLDPGLEWVNAWNNGSPETGNVDVNRLVRQHRLRIEHFKTIETSAYALVSSEEVLNTYALADQFRAIPGVRSAEPETAIGGGQDILASYTANGLQLTYWKGAGDCTAGCIYKKSWDFLLDKRGRVSYLGTRGYLPSDTMTSYQ